MNSRERILTTLRHQQADRVPIAEMWIDPQVVQAIVPEARDSNDLVEHLGLDMVTVPTMIYEADEVDWVDRGRGHLPRQLGRAPAPDARSHPRARRSRRASSREDDLARYTPPDPAKSPVIEKVRRLRARFPGQGRGRGGRVGLGAGGVPARRHREPVPGLGHCDRSSPRT